MAAGDVIAVLSRLEDARDELPWDRACAHEGRDAPAVHTYRLWAAA